MNKASKLTVPCSSMTCLNALGMLSEKQVHTNQTWRRKLTHCTHVWGREIWEKPSQHSLYRTRREAGRLMDTATSQQSITESIRLEKASDIIESNLWQNITVSTRPWHREPHAAFLWTPPGTVTPPPPVAVRSIKKFFLIPKLNLPWRSSKLRPLVLSKYNPFRSTSKVLQHTAQRTSPAMPANGSVSAGAASR